MGEVMTPTTYGPTLSRQEYKRRLANLQFRLVELEDAGKSDAAINAYAQIKEFELNIDYKLGIDFPERKREPIRVVHRAMQQRSESLAADLLAKNNLSPFGPVRSLQRLIRRVIFYIKMQRLALWSVDKLADVMDPQDFEPLMGVKPGSKTLLPLDPFKIEN